MTQRVRLAPEVEARGAEVGAADVLSLALGLAGRHLARELLEQLVRRRDDQARRDELDHL